MMTKRFLMSAGAFIHGIEHERDAKRKICFEFERAGSKKSRPRLGRGRRRK
jgi:hypothetical protein